MAEFTDREQYIPIRKRDLIDLLCKDSRLDPSSADRFRQFAQLISAIWHFEYHQKHEQLKDAYAPFDPDAVTIPLTQLTPDQRAAKIDQFFEQFIALMERSNFKRLSRREIDAAIEGGASDWGVNMSVDWDIFERLEIFQRGEAQILRTKGHWLFFWRTIEKKVDSYRRLVMLVKLRKSKRLPAYIDTDDIFVKMFKDIPKMDLEMILPGTSLQMPLLQKLKLGGSFIGTIGYGIYSLGTKLVAAIFVLIGVATTFAIDAIEFAVLMPLFILFGYGYKQYHAYQVTRQQYAKKLAENLYYQSLDNNSGVIAHSIDEAEEQECRETLLAYFYLWKYAPAAGWTAEQLDDYIEMDLEAKVKLKLDFEIGDAIAKLESLQLVTSEGGHYQAVAIDRALQLLDQRWDNYFPYHRA